jgi:hypothetical protein
MDDPHAAPEQSDTGYGAWFGFWAQFVVLGGLAIWGAFFASDGEPGDYACGMILTLGAIALAFLRLKAWFDGDTSGWVAFLFVDRMPNLAVVIPVFAVIALAGLFVAAGAQGALQSAGVGLFVASGIIIFLSLKRVFDNLDTHH